MATLAAETSAGLTTSWVPLTTAGPTYSPECASAIYLNPQNNASIGAFDPWYGQNVNTALRCQLPQQTTWWDQVDLAASTLYNLGPLACPNGYTTATTNIINAQSTVLACCPSGYDYQNSILPAPDANECFSTLTKGQVITHMSSGDGSWAPTTVTITETGSVIHGVQINGWNFASSSTSSLFSAAQTSVSASRSTYSSTSSSSTVALSASSSSSIPSTENGGLSSGAKAGIAIAVALGVIGICCFVAAFIFFRRRQTPAKEGHENFITPPDYYSQSSGVQRGEFSGVEKYPDASHTLYTPQQHMEPVEVSGESKPRPPVEIG